MPPPVSYSPVGAQSTKKSTDTPSTPTSRWLPVKWPRFRVTSGHVRSRDVISSHVTATCKFQPCRNSNAPKTRFIHLPPLSVDFQWNDVTCGSFPVIWGHVTSFPVMWRPPPASFIPVGAQTYPKDDLYAFYSHFQVTSAQMTLLPGHLWSVRSCDVISCHVTTTSCELQPCRSSNVHKTRHTPSTAPCRWLSVKWRHFRVTNGHVR